MWFKSEALVQLALFDLPPSKWASHTWRQQTRGPRTQEAPYKNKLQQPVKLRSLGVNVKARAPVYLHLFYRHTYTRTRSTWPDLNPAGRFYNRITEASCYFCSLHCPKTHNWIEEFMVFPPFLFSLAFSPLPPSFLNRKSAQQEPLTSVILAQYASVVTGNKEGDCWSKSVIFKLTGKHPTWTQTRSVSHSDSS